MATSKPVPDLGDVVAKDPQQLQRFLERVREVIQTREGRRGTVLQKGVTYQDLADLGLIARLDSGRYAGVVDAIPGPAGPPGPPGADGGSYTPDLTPPPAAVFVGVTPGFSYLYVEWVQPVYTEGHGHAYTEVWAAQYGGTGPLPTFDDAEIVSRETGNFYAYPAGIEVQVHFWLVNRTNDDVAQVTPTGGTNGQYAMTLGLPIAHLLEVLTGEITASQLYTDLSTPIGSIYANEDNAAADALRVALAVWDEQNQRATDLLNEAAQRGTDIRTTQTLIDEGDAQLAQQITTLTATVTTNQSTALAAVESEALARADGDSAEADQRDLLAVQMRGTYTGSDLASVATGLIAAERDLRASQTAAAASRLDALEVSVDTPSTGLLARTATLETAVVDLDGDIVAGASRITALEASVDTPSTGLLARATALETVTTNVSSGNVALANRASALEATVDDPTDGVAATYAALQVEETVRADQTGHLGAQYSVRATIAGSGGTVAGGFGLSGTSGGAAGPTIDFGVLANTFYVAAPSGSGTAELIPFIVKTTTWDDNGVSRPAGVYIKGAFIENLVAVYATISSLVADDITAADITAAQILAGSLRVGGYLQSTSYVAGTSGWRISADGTAELSGVIVRGTVYATAGLIGGITIASNALRAGQTAYNTGVGFHLGSDGRLSLGNSAGNRLTWDGTDLTVVGGGTFSGALSAASGTFAGSLSAATGTFAGTLTAGAINAVDTINMKGQSISANYLTTIAEILKTSGGTSQLLVLGTDGLQSSLVSFTYGALETFIVVNAHSKLGTTNARWLDIEITPTLVDNSGTLVSTGFASKIRVYAIPTAGTQQFFGAAHSEVFSGMSTGSYRVRFSVSVTCRAGDDSLQNNLTELAVTARILLINRKV